MSLPACNIWLVPWLLMSSPPVAETVGTAEKRPICPSSPGQVDLPNTVGHGVLPASLADRAHLRDKTGETDSRLSLLLRRKPIKTRRRCQFTRCAAGLVSFVLLLLARTLLRAVSKALGALTCMCVSASALMSYHDHIETRHFLAGHVRDQGLRKCKLIQLVST